MPDLVDLEIMMLSRVPLIVIETFEEPRALELITRAGMKQQKPVFSWSVTEGIQRIDMAHSVPEHLTNSGLPAVPAPLHCRAPLSALDRTLSPRRPNATPSL